MTSTNPPTAAGLTLLNVILILIVAGGVGGLVNAFLSVEGFYLPKLETLADNTRIWRPGFLGNASVGSVSSFVLGGLYGPLAPVVIGNGTPVLLTVGVVAGAVVSGVGGARILTQEVDKKLSNATNRQMRRVVQNLLPAEKNKD